MSEEKVKCNTCQWYESDRGLCRRYPPTVVEGSNGDLNDITSSTYFYWPQVQPDEWCGEYKSLVPEKSNSREVK